MDSLRANSFATRAATHRGFVPASPRQECEHGHGGPKPERPWRLLEYGWPFLVSTAFFWALGFGLLLAPSQQAWAQEPTGTTSSAAARQPRQDDEQLVLLNTGMVLHGQATREPDLWTVRSGRGSIIRLEVHQVDIVAENFDHLLEQLHARTGREQVSQRFKIVRLCMKHERFEEARKELEWLEQDGADAATIGQLRQILEATERLALTRHEREEASAGATPSPAGTVDSTHATNTSATRQDDAEPEQFVSIDSEAFGAFVVRIQPPLLVGCAAARCHGPQGVEGFHLERLELGATPTRRMSEANYREVQRWALQAEEGESLVDWAMRSHGGSRERAWRQDESKTSELRAWLEWVRRLERQRLVETGGPNADGGIRQASYRPDAEATGSPAGGSADDPYDPRVFNQYRELREQLRRGGLALPPQSELPREEPVQEPATDPSGARPAFSPRRLDMPITPRPTTPGEPR
ncbi:MAG: hypothetical protein KDA83_00285 [Planctomycetales bacterium]|nr:hypothetical protein [Planctomycetales bacterium]